MACLETNPLLDPRYAVKRVRNVRIPMPDGITLAADLFMPDAEGRFPVAFDHYPYRKNDQPPAVWVGHTYLAARGIVAARIDVRGTGDSEGTALDEYCPREQLDGVAAIAWLAEQPWSNGKVVTFVARLCDVAPDGASALVTKGIMNATHRDSHANPTPIVPGQSYRLAIQLDATSWVFEPGHRIRLTVSSANFPNTWPSPTPATSQLFRRPHFSRRWLQSFPRDLL